jgi:asparagine synthase (glutamine-hydrolysing)
LPFQPPFEKRYPCLDRGLLEFIYAVPREQLVRPGQRRSLMRRSLVSIVPNELLNRRRKAFVARGPMAAVTSEWSTLLELTHRMVSSSLGIVNSKELSVSLQKARHGQQIHIVLLLRTIILETWLKHLSSGGLLINSVVVPQDKLRCLTPTVISAEKN